MKFSLATLLFAVLALNCNCAPTTENTVEQKNPVKKSEAKVIDTFFANRLGGKSVGFDSATKVDLSEVENFRSGVWQLWCNAVKGDEQQQLIELKPIAQASSGRWQLPANLENATMPYYYGSKGNKPAEGYPLFVYLHGSGNKQSEWATGLQLAKRFDDSPSMYFIPQIPDENSYRWYQQSKQYAVEKLLRLSMIGGNTNPDRIYLFGISEGGYGSQRMASFYADYLAGAGPMAGGEPLINAPVENCASTAFSFLTGSEDKMFERYLLTTITGQRFEELAEQYPGYYTHRIELIAGRGHAIDYSPTTPWLKAFSRNPYPKFVNWEDFEMDGRHRSGFYNIMVVERPKNDAGERARYQMTIDGNNIDMKVDMVEYSTAQTSPTWGFAIRYNKSFTPAVNGRFVLCLSGELVDLTKPVVLTVNGVKCFEGLLECRLENMVNSCAEFGDPKRLYPCAIEVDLSTL